MKKNVLYLIIGIFSCCDLPAQENPKIVGNLHDGSPSGSVVQSDEKVIDLDVIKQHERVVAGRKITMMKVVRPDLVDHKKKSVPTPQVPTIVEPATSLPRQFLQLVSTSYDGKFSRLSWFHEGEEYEAFTNVDARNWNGFTNFEADGKNITFMHMGSYVRTGKTMHPSDRNAGWLSFFPPVSEGIYFYITKGDPGNNEAISPVMSLHSLYVAEEDRLIAARRNREASREAMEAEEKANPLSEDIEIFYWRKKAAR